MDPCPGERVGGGCCIVWGDACCLAERGSKAPGSKYLPRKLEQLKFILEALKANGVKESHFVSWLGEVLQAREAHRVYLAQVELGRRKIDGQRGTYFRNLELQVKELEALCAFARGGVLPPTIRQKAVDYNCKLKIASVEGRLKLLNQQEDLEAGAGTLMVTTILTAILVRAEKDRKKPERDVQNISDSCCTRIKGHERPLPQSLWDCTTTTRPAEHNDAYVCPTWSSVSGTVPDGTP